MDRLSKTANLTNNSENLSKISSLDFFWTIGKLSQTVRDELNLFEYVGNNGFKRDIKGRWRSLFYCHRTLYRCIFKKSFKSVSTQWVMNDLLFDLPTFAC
jgi:hypothetical protein